MIDRSLTYSGVVSKTNTMESVWYGEEEKIKKATFKFETLSRKFK